MIIAYALTDEAYKLTSILPQSVKEQAQAFSSHRERSFLANRALLALMLKVFFNTDVKDGFPEMAKVCSGKPVFKDLRYPFFNISHSRQSICIAMSETCQCTGIDIEYIRPRASIQRLIDWSMSNREKEHIRTLTDDKITPFFTAMWTVRESLVKASGRGLVDTHSIEIDPLSEEISYYSLPAGLTVNTLRFDELQLSAEPSYLSYTALSDETPRFYELKGDELVKKDSPRILSEFKVNPLKSG